MSCATRNFHINSDSNLLSPFLSYFAPLLFTLMLYYMGFSVYFTSGSNIETLLSLVIIFFVPLFYMQTPMRKPSNSFALDFHVGKVVLWMTGASTIAYVIQLAVLGMPPLLKARNKAAYFVFGVSLFFYLAQFVAPMAYAWWRISGKKLFLFAYFLNLSMLVSMMNKNPVIQTLCATFFMHLLFSKRKITFLWLKVFGFACMLVIVVYMMFLLNPVFANYEGYFYILQKEQGVIGIKDPILSLIYMYAASNWENFFHFLENPAGYSYGSMFFQPVVKLLKIDAIIPSVVYPELITSTLKSPRLITATAFFRMFCDFGYFSLFTYLVVYFGAVYCNYRRLVKKCTFSRIYFQVYLNVFLAFMFFDNYFFLTISAFGFVCAFFFIKLSRFRFVWGAP